MRSEFDAVTEALQKSSDLTPVCLEMLVGMLPKSLGVLEDERHPYQREVVNMVQDALWGIEHEYKKDIEDKQNVLDEILQEKDGFTKAQENVEKVLEEKQSVHNSKKDVHSEKVAAHGEKEAAFKELQKVHKACGAAVEALVAKRDKCASVVTETLAKVNGESWDAKESKKLASTLIGLGRELGFEESLLSGLGPATEKKPEDRGTFHVAALKHYEEQLQKQIEAQEASLPGLETPAAQALAALQDAEAALQAAHEEVQTALEATNVAHAEVKEHDAVVAVKRKETKDVNPRLRKAQRETENAEAELEAFQECYMRPFEELRDRQSPHVTIDGSKYDRALLKQAESFAQDGQISFAEARSLLDEAQDDEIKRQTISYSMGKLTFTDKAVAFVKSRLEENHTKSYYKQIGGVKYDRELLEKAEDFAKDGQISYAEALQLWEEAQDGKGVTEIEKQTLLHTMKAFAYTDKAAAFMNSSLDGGEPKSYYKQIDGVKYDRTLLEKAEEFGKNGQVSLAEARELWDEAQDGKRVTEIEKQTLSYTMKIFKYTTKAEAFMKSHIDSGEHKSYYKQIDGVRYDRALLEKAEGYAKDGEVSHAEARELWEEAQDGKGVTEIEKQTLLYTMKSFSYTARAAKFMKSCLGGGDGEEPKSYYKQIDGVKYDRELLEMAEEFAKDGQISYPEAKELWEDAQDGKGVTDTEKETLLYTLKTFKFTDKAAAFLRPLLEEGESKSYYKQIKGQRYDRELLEKAEEFAKDGNISYAEARALWEEAQDGKGVTTIENNTLIYTVKTYHYTEKALTFMLKMTGGEEGKSYYKHISGVKYDRALLEKVEELAKDGEVSLSAAKQLLEEAKDGKGITDVEKQTLLYSMTAFTYADDASAFLREKLA